jgi:type IV pilus assembly protein PilV
MIGLLNRTLQAGFTLIEVLIALLVLSLGLVGLATLYLTSLGSVHSGLLTSLASSIALDVEERLWVEVGRTGDGTCPDVNAVLVQVEGDWSRPDAEFLRIPGLSLTAGTITPGGRFQQVPLTISWTENRFNEGDDNAAVEEFEYNARIYCFPAP